jgi:hypothetical protein
MVLPPVHREQSLSAYCGTESTPEQRRKARKLHKSQIESSVSNRLFATRCSGPGARKSGIDARLWLLAQLDSVLLNIEFVSRSFDLQRGNIVVQ